MFLISIVDKIIASWIVAKESQIASGSQKVKSTYEIGSYSQIASNKKKL